MARSIRAALQSVAQTYAVYDIASMDERLASTGAVLAASAIPTYKAGRVDLVTILRHDSSFAS